MMGLVLSEKGGRDQNSLPFEDTTNHKEGSHQNPTMLVP